MPEIVTRYPDVVLSVLRGGGARCGVGEPQKILKQCRPERFCATDAGEICVFGLDEIGSMTQVPRADLAARVCSTSPGATGGCAGCVAAPASLPDVSLALLVAGVILLVRRAARSVPATPRRDRPV